MTSLVKTIWNLECFKYNIQDSSSHHVANVSDFGVQRKVLRYPFSSVFRHLTDENSVTVKHFQLLSSFFLTLTYLLSPFISLWPLYSLPSSLSGLIISLIQWIRGMGVLKLYISIYPRWCCVYTPGVYTSSIWNRLEIPLEMNHICVNSISTSLEFT